MAYRFLKHQAMLLRRQLGWQVGGTQSRSQSSTEIEARLADQLITQMAIAVYPTLCGSLLVLMSAWNLPFRSAINAILIVRAIALVHDLYWAQQVRKSLDKRQLDHRAMRRLTWGYGFSCFIWSSLVWPIAPQPMIDVPMFLIFSATLIATCMFVVSSAYHRPTMHATIIGAVLATVPKIIQIYPITGPVVPLGYALYIAILLAFGRGIERQARSIVQQTMRRRRVSYRLADANAALQLALNNANWLADHDILTNLRNRRAFARELQEQFRHSDQATCLMLIDIDHFKRINDQLGHAIGDTVLGRIGDCLRAWEADLNGRITGRWGGEEFIALAPLGNNRRAHSEAEELRRRISALEIFTDTDQSCHLSASIGCVLLYGTDSFDDALRIADTALYQAKNAGRNRSHVAA